MVSPNSKVNRRIHDAPASGPAASEDPAQKPKDAARTRARILEAAQRAFSNRGYGQAGLREIAADAGVNVALVGRYFGSKEGLFEAALGALLSARPIWEAPRETFGRSLVARFVDESRDGPNPLPVLMQAAADPVAQSVALGLIQTRLIAPLGEWIGGTDGEVRAGEVLALCAGFFTYRIMMPLEPFSGQLDPAVRRWMENALQDIIDGRAGAPRPTCP